MSGKTHVRSNDTAILKGLVGIEKKNIVIDLIAF